MPYRIRLKIVYDYEVAVSHGQALLRVEPQDIPGVQSLRSIALRIDPPPDEQGSFRDFFGNAVRSLNWRKALETLTLSLSLEAERFEHAIAGSGASLSDLPDFLVANRDLGPCGPHHYLSPSRLVTIDAEMQEFALDAIRPGMTVGEVVHAVSGALHREMRFVAGETDVTTSAAQAFAKRRGVCQDFAHVLIASLRSIGVPAGYVSGFLRTIPPPGQPRLEGVDAMHAWVRAWTGPETGWVEIDPTNDQRAGLDYITIGCGRDYDDIAPVRGSLRGTGEQSSVQSVDVLPLERA